VPPRNDAALTAFSPEATRRLWRDSRVKVYREEVLEVLEVIIGGDEPLVSNAPFRQWLTIDQSVPL
jgi:hypothetical protein